MVTKPANPCKYTTKWKACLLISTRVFIAHRVVNAVKSGQVPYFAKEFPKGELNYWLVKPESGTFFIDDLRVFLKNDRWDGMCNCLTMLHHAVFR